MQLSVIIMLFGLILGLVELNETYKIVKPYKYYNPHPPRPPRWHPFPKSRKHYHPQRIPPQKYHSYDSEDYHRYAPFYEDSVDTSDNDKPYVIVIQLPRKKEKKYRPYQRQHVIDAPRDIDYIDDYDDELKVYQIDNKTLRIKVNDRLSVLTS